MASAVYITPEEHINFLYIEQFEDDFAYFIKEKELDDSYIDVLKEIKEKMLDALIKLPSQNRARKGSPENLYLIGGTIRKEDTNLYNQDKDDSSRITLNKNKYTELLEKGETEILESPSGQYGPNIPLGDRIKHSTEKAKSIINACKEKIELINNVQKGDEKYLIKDDYLLWLPPQNILCKFILKYLELTDKVLDAKYRNIIDKLSNRIKVFNTKGQYVFLNETKINSRFNQYESSYDKIIDSLNSEQFQKLKLIIDKYLKS